MCNVSNSYCSRYLWETQLMKKFPQLGYMKLLSVMVTYLKDVLNYVGLE